MQRQNKKKVESCPLCGKKCERLEELVVNKVLWSFLCPDCLEELKRNLRFWLAMQKLCPAEKLMKEVARYE